MTKRLVIHTYETIYPIRSGVHSRVWQIVNAAQSLDCTVSIVSSTGKFPRRTEWKEASRAALRKAGIELYLSNYSVLGIDFWLSFSEYIYRKQISKSVLPKPGGLYFKRPQLEKVWKYALHESKCTHSIVNYCNWINLVKIARCNGAISGIEMIDSLTDQYVETSVAMGRGRPDEDKIRKYRSIEESALSLANLVIAINPNEAAVVAERTAVPVLYIPYCTEPRWLQNDIERPIDILIVGSATSHNINGFHDFIFQALPKLRVSVPNIRVKVCGGLCNSIDDSHGVEKAGFVQDLTLEYNTSKVVLLVTKTGAGIKIKTIEALAHGACIVAHKHCVSGIEVQPDSIELVDDLRDCFKQLHSLLVDPVRQKLFRERSKQGFIQKYHPVIGVNALRRFLDR